jgi:hypothetical protein
MQKMGGREREESPWKRTGGLVAKERVQKEGNAKTVAFGEVRECREVADGGGRVQDL